MAEPIGSAGLPRILSQLRDSSAFKVAIVTLPPADHPAQRIRVAIDVVKALPNMSDATIVVPYAEAPFHTADADQARVDYLTYMVAEHIASLVELVAQTGYINIDFADIRAILKASKYCHIGTARSYGSDRAGAAASLALLPFAIGRYIHLAKSVVVTVVGGSDLSLLELDHVVRVVAENCRDDAMIVAGNTIREIDGQLSVSVLIGGLNINYEYLYMSSLASGRHSPRETPHLTPVPAAIADSLRAFRDDCTGNVGAAFLVMDFAHSRFHAEIAAAIRKLLEEHGIRCVRADDKTYHEDLYYNVLTYLHGSDFVVAVFDRINANVFNPNVALEVGYALALRKDICLLKERTLEKLPTDIVSKVYMEFDLQDIDASVRAALGKWLVDRKIVIGAT